METPIQETINKVNNITSAVIDKANLLHFLAYQLEKEKQQIMKAYREGFKNSAEGFNGEHPMEGYSDEQIDKEILTNIYFNKTYNQNKNQ